MTSRRRRKKGRTLGGIAMVLLALAALGLFMNLFIFRVRSVEVAGYSSLTAEEVIAHSGIVKGSSIMKVREEDVRRNIEKQGILLLDQMTVYYPSTVALSVSERQSAMMILTGATFLVLDRDMWVISAGTDRPDGSLVRVSGSDVFGYEAGSALRAGETRMEEAKRIYALLESEGAVEYAREIDVSDMNGLRIISRSNVTVLLGDADNMTDKIRWMKGVLDDMAQRGETGGKLDITSGTRPALDQK